ncbi:hypothetical protein HLB44_15635 [Aquincola sp. S2]|uniref:SMP-30/Gluconolactonase/LRE-like region domain-containing protein n=1 Tax=Pseudaquabacterium terrae TaxID=2732868 RepID=A0ABX2EIM5_9BURK|nr:hypothetical protein [Aquabacterium terrae]NRF68426.1 hypothetical protein [Aquabacterium terrae]
MHRHLPRLAAAWLAACLVAGAAAQPVADDPQAPLRAQLARIEALRTQRPGDGVLVYYQAMTLARLDRRNDALAALRSLTGRRLGIVPTAGMGFDALWQDAEFSALREQLSADEPRTPDAPRALHLADPALIPEGIAHDAETKRFFIGSVARHKIVVVDARGRARDFSRPGDRLDAVLGLHVDAKRRVLLAVSTNAFEDSGKTALRNAVLRYPLNDPRRVQRLDAPAAQQLNDVVAAPDGTLFATDSASGSLLRAAPGATLLEPFGQRGALLGANGIAVAPDGSLFVTLSTGIARVNPADGSFQRLPQPDQVVTGGIDGLYWHDGDLVGVQNVTIAGRVIRIHLADAGRRIGGITVLQSHHHPDFDEPTTGTIAGVTLVTIANSQVARYQADGSLREPATLKAPQLIAVPLRR